VFFNVNVAQAACDTKSLKGNYEIAVKANTCAYIGVANFDGKGTMTMNTVRNCGGGVINSNWTLSYKINANCTGSATGNNIAELGDLNFVFNSMLTNGGMLFNTGSGLFFGTIIKQ
jgi:hypothetical protein